MTIKIEEGDQWLVDSLTINGISQVNRDEVTSALASAEGQPFSEVSLANDRNSVLTYYYKRGFDNADLKATWEPSALPHHVNVLYAVTEGRREFVREVITSGLRPHGRAWSIKNSVFILGIPFHDRTDRDSEAFLRPWRI